MTNITNGTKRCVVVGDQGLILEHYLGHSVDRPILDQTVTFIWLESGEAHNVNYLNAITEEPASHAPKAYNIYNSCDFSTVSTKININACFQNY